MKEIQGRNRAQKQKSCGPVIGFLHIRFDVSACYVQRVQRQDGEHLRRNDAIQENHVEILILKYMIIKIKNSKKILTAGEIQIQILLIIGNIVQRKI